jgi:hypothetical protein
MSHSTMKARAQARHLHCCYLLCYPSQPTNTFSHSLWRIREFGFSTRLVCLTMVCLVALPGDIRAPFEPCLSLTQGTCVLFRMASHTPPRSMLHALIPCRILSRGRSERTACAVPEAPRCARDQRTGPGRRRLASARDPAAPNRRPPGQPPPPRPAYLP